MPNKTVVAKLTYNPFEGPVGTNNLDALRKLPVLASVVTVLPAADDRTSRTLEQMQAWQSVSSVPFTTPRFDVEKSVLKKQKPRSVILDDGNARLYSSALPSGFEKSGRTIPASFEADTGLSGTRVIIAIVAIVVAVMAAGLLYWLLNRRKS